MSPCVVWCCTLCGKEFPTEEALDIHIKRHLDEKIDDDGNEIVKNSGNNNVDHPSHYTFGDIEVIDYIRDKLTPTEFQGYCMGNVLKYVSRWRHKGGAEDLKKARNYLNWGIDSAEGEKTK